jgi:hypothetical protein
MLMLGSLDVETVELVRWVYGLMSKPASRAFADDEGVVVWTGEAY